MASSYNLYNRPEDIEGYYHRYRWTNDEFEDPFEFNENKIDELFSDLNYTIDRINLRDIYKGIFKFSLEKILYVLKMKDKPESSVFHLLKTPRGLQKINKFLDKNQIKILEKLLNVTTINDSEEKIIKLINFILIHKNYKNYIPKEFGISFKKVLFGKLYGKLKTFINQNGNPINTNSSRPIDIQDL